MSHKRLLVAATIIASIILAGFVLSVPRTSEIAPESLVESAKISLPEVVLRDGYKKGVHTITGSIEAPDACTTVSAQAVLVGDTPESQTILIDITMPEDSGICLERPSVVRFSVTITAPARLPITATVNGVAATTTAS